MICRRFLSSLPAAHGGDAELGNVAVATAHFAEPGCLFKFRKYVPNYVRAVVVAEAAALLCRAGSVACAGSAAFTLKPSSLVRRRDDTIKNLCVCSDARCHDVNGAGLVLVVAARCGAAVH